MGAGVERSKMSSLGKLGGKKSGEARRNKGEIRDVALSVLSVKINYPKALTKMLEEVGIPTDKKRNIWSAIVTVQALKALSGDLKSAYFCADIGGLSARAQEQKAKVKMLERMAENADKVILEPPEKEVSDISLDAIRREAEALGIYGND